MAPTHNAPRPLVLRLRLKLMLQRLREKPTSMSNLEAP